MLKHLVETQELVRCSYLKLLLRHIVIIALWVQVLMVLSPNPILQEVQGTSCGMGIIHFWSDGV